MSEQEWGGGGGWRPLCIKIGYRLSGRQPII